MKYNNGIPTNAETVSYSTYKVQEKTPSKFLPNNFTNIVIGFNCPRCDRLHSYLDHGEYTKCKCGLEMKLYGNGLSIWDKHGGGN